MSILTVSQLNTYISFKLKNDPKLKGVAIKGEISDVSPNSRSGHIYFTLRDEVSSIKAVMFAGSASKLKFQPFDGMSVIAYGNIEVYERVGVCQIIVTQLIPDGAGNAYFSLLKLKEKLQALGVFSAPKKAVPKYPEKIAVVTSPDGAAIEDVKNIISRRYPIVDLKLFPAAVQGQSAPASIVSAIEKADSSAPDVIIVTRGGGSSDDLSAFNTEAVVMAVFNAKSPVISAVGHEIDWTLCDLAADLRAPTPSGAAELATPDISEMHREIDALASAIKFAFENKLSVLNRELQRYRYILSALSVEGKIKERSAELSSLKEKAERLFKHRLELYKSELSGIENNLKSLDPLGIISRGYAVIYKDGEVAADVLSLKSGDGIKIMMRNGSAEAEVKNVIQGEKR